MYKQSLKKSLKIALMSLALLVMQPGIAGISSSAQMPEVREIQSEWARLYYMDEFLNKNYRELQALSQQADKLAEQHPQNAEVLVWDAIVLSTLAEKKGGLGALGLVKQAKHQLEQAETIDPEVLGGSIYASLGSLYSKVPGWPIGFGDDEKAEQYFKKALAINPQGLDINYFFAEYLVDQGEEIQALEHLELALQAEPMVDRPVADQGRRQQALKLRAELTGS
jgi:tetratricopeptide (TPR) repeat protein